mmetsp:Transcript_19234/g.3111  ORF Transcript_19234/g.3111 Transcript_19234/m.3111 type:complete len:102 (+) Transcript_19234:282-587(+)
MLNTIGSTSLGSTLIMVKVVISKDTLAPDLSFYLSIFGRHPTTYLGPLDALIMYFSSSISFKTSPRIYPAFYRDFRSSSVLSYSYLELYIYSLNYLTLCSI